MPPVARPRHRARTPPAPPPPRRRLATALAVGAACAPLVVAAVHIAWRAPTIAWTGDRALTELGVRQALAGHQLLGMGGRFGWRHPGPLWLYLLAPIYQASGRAPWSLALGVLALHVAWIVIAVWSVARAGGPRAAALVAVCVTVYLRATGLHYWTNLWAGYAFTFPVLALVALCAVAGADEGAGWAFPAAMLTGTFLVQTDVSTVVVVVAVGAAALAARLARWGWRGLLRSRVSAVSGAGVLLIGLVAEAWVPPLVEQVRGRPGNLTLLARFGERGEGGHSLRVAAAATGAALSVWGAGARWVLRDGVERRLGAGPWWAVGLVAVALVALVGSGLWGWRRGGRLGPVLALLSAVGVVAAIVAMSRVDGAITFYLLTWITVLPVTGVAGTVLSLGAGWPQRVALVGALVVAALVSVTQAGVHDYDRAASAGATTLTARTFAALGPRAHGRVRVHVVTADAWQLAAGVALQLERNGARIEVDPDWVFLFGDAFAPAPGPPTAELWFGRPHELPLLEAAAGAVDLGGAGPYLEFARQD